MSENIFEEAAKQYRRNAIYVLSLVTVLGVVIHILFQIPFLFALGLGSLTVHLKAAISIIIKSYQLQKMDNKIKVVSLEDIKKEREKKE